MDPALVLVRVVLRAVCELFGAVEFEPLYREHDNERVETRPSPLLESPPTAREQNLLIGDADLLHVKPAAGEPVVQGFAGRCHVHEFIVPDF